MTLQQLEYVMAVYRCQHFAKAADSCHVTQPTLSAMIQKLESELNVKIFDRSRQPILPTPLGKIIIDQAEKVLADAKELSEMVEEYKHSLEGSFRMGVLPTIAPYLIPRFFPQLMDEFPKLDIRISELKTDEMKLAIARGDIDAGILAQIDGLEEFESRHLFYEKFFVYVAENDALFNNKAIRTVDLNGEFLWLLDEGHFFRDQLVKFCQLKSAKRSKEAYNLGSIETFMRIVEGGKGVTFIPELSMLQLTDEQRRLVKPFAFPIPSRQVVLLTAKNFVRNTLLNLITERIQASVPKEMISLGKKQQAVF